MNLAAACCCAGCSSDYRVFKPCDETSEALYLRRAVTTTAGLDAEFGSGQWEGVVFHYNGQCNCAPYCGTWICRSDVEKDGPDSNVCDPVPCDTSVSGNPCPDCTDETYEDYVYVRPQDIGTRFSSVDDCCDPVCDNEQACLGGLIDPNDCGVFVDSEYTFSDPILTGGALAFAGLNGQFAFVNLTGYGVVDVLEDTQAKSRQYLIRVDWRVSISGGEGQCVGGGDAQTSTGFFYMTALVQPCNTTLPDQGSCIATETVVNYDDLNVPTDFQGRGHPDPVQGSPCPGTSDVIRVKPWFELTPPTYTVRQDECARYASLSSVYYTFSLELAGTYPLGQPTPAEATEQAARCELEFPVTYPAEP